jgi:hypothetical protein
MESRKHEHIQVFSSYHIRHMRHPRDLWHPMHLDLVHLAYKSKERRGILIDLEFDPIHGHSVSRAALGWRVLHTAQYKQSDRAPGWDQFARRGSVLEE